MNQPDPTQASEQLLAGRYAISRELGRGSQGRTLLAKDRQTDAQVVLKELDFGQIERAKVIGLFEREARVLKSLNHPQIPTYFDQFHLTEPDGHVQRYFLVQEYIEGDNLRDLVRQGQLFDEAQVRDLMAQILRILRYLHAQQTPLIHRDVKPSNIMQRPDKSYALIDFGAVQQQILAAHASSTVVGTSGYMPHEQLMGRALPSSDLYALAATAVFLLSRRSPSDLLNPELGLDFRPYVNISEPFADLLTQLLAPYPEDRPSSAGQALNLLENLPSEASPPDVERPRPTPDPALTPKSRTQQPSDLQSLERMLATPPHQDAPYSVQERVLILGRGNTPLQQRSNLKIKDGYLRLKLPPNRLLALALLPLYALILAACGVVLAPLILALSGLWEQYILNPDIWLLVILGGIGLLSAAASAGTLIVLSRFARLHFTLLSPPQLKIKNRTLYYRNYAQRERLKLDLAAIQHVAIIKGSETTIDNGTYFRQKLDLTTEHATMMEVYAGSAPGRALAINADIGLDEQFYLMGELWTFIKREVG